ncbi:MAG: transporter [Halothece sp. Uz-M2-17]|nr:transporter [Halothece sp. Uz-M2-17]
MIQCNWFLLSAAFSLLIPLPALSQTQPLTAIRGTELDRAITVTPVSENNYRLQNTNTIAPIQLNRSEVSIQFISLPLTEGHLSINENEKDGFPFQPTNLILAHSDEHAAPDEWTSGRPDGHAPLGVMGDHVHGQGEWMLSYRYMFMSMDGNRDGTEDLSTNDVLEDFMVAPDDMTMQMHMLGAMYAPTDNLTLMAMVPFVVKEMDHVTRMGTEFTTNSSGIGDIKFSGLYQLFNQDRQSVHLNLGFSVPTGSIDERDDTPAGNDVILPYPMQIGSGTLDLRPGITYLGQTDDWSWGAQANTVLRLGENDRDYTVGNRYQLMGWIARRMNEKVSVSLRLDGETWDDYDGADSALNPNLIPTADPDLRGGTRLDLGLGANLYLPESFLPGGRLAAELEFPLYQSLEGPQLETDWQLTVGVQSAF